MNQIIKSEKGILCITEDGASFEMKEWYEKKKDKYHYVFINDSLNPTGRHYFSKDMVDEALNRKGSFNFENKTTEPRKLGNWRDRLTDEEKAELAQAEETIQRLKDLGLNRRPKTEVEKLQEEIERLKALLGKTEK